MLFSYVAVKQYKSRCFISVLDALKTTCPIGSCFRIVSFSSSFGDISSDWIPYRSNRARFPHSPFLFYGFCYIANHSWWSQMFLQPVCISVVLVVFLPHCPIVPSHVPSGHRVLDWYAPLVSWLSYSPFWVDICYMSCIPTPVLCMDSQSLYSQLTWYAQYHSQKFILAFPAYGYW